jgi:hypothetical protein
MAFGPKHNVLTAVAVIAILVGIGIYFFGFSRTPKGQSSLVILTQANSSEFVRAFNAAAGQPRLVLLLSPT